jgi:hypothetical protein
VTEFHGTKTRRLSSWKEIAAHLGRDVRTVIRWEKERGLPVHRDSSGTGRPTVYSDINELDSWLMGHSGGITAPLDLPDPTAPVPQSPSTYRLYFIVAALAVIVAAAAFFVSRHFVGTVAQRHLVFARSDFPAGGPMSVGIADFDRDGNLDIVFTNSATNTVDVIFGDGHGQFGRRISIPNAQEPERLAIADFNHDGNPDLVITHRTSKDISVVLNDGHGDFREAYRWDAEGRSRWVAAADLNGDNILDFVVACSSAHKLAVLLGRGDGTFDNIREYDTDGEPSAALVGDFNHDNIPDIVTADYQVSGGKTISLYPGVGDGTFRARQPFRTGPGPLAATAADLNHDGLLDIATADFHDGLSVLLATKDGFAAPRAMKVQSAPGFIAAADFDSDGHLDLLLVAEHSNEAHLYYGDGRGDFPTSQTFTTAAYPDSIAVADLDHDGRLDFVVGAIYGNTLSVYLNRTPRRP